MESRLSQPTFLCTLLAALLLPSAEAAIVDFENEIPLVPDPTLIAVGDSYVNGGITFTSTEVMQLVGVGSPTDGFVPNDTPGSTASGPASFGSVFLTGDFIDNTDMTLSFDTNLSSIGFDIVDIDGGNDSIVGDAQEEQFTFDFLLGGVSQGSQLITSRDLTGTLNEAGVVRVLFAGLFDQVSIVGVTPGGTRNIGWGIDNIETSPVPLPAAAWLFASALGAFGYLGKRKAKG